MAGDDYIRKKISGYRLVPGPSSAANKAKDTLTPLIIEWASSHLVNVDFSGSYAKDTAIKGATDVDLFISFDSAEPRSLKDLYDGLYSHLLNKGYFSTRKQNVSIGVSLDSQKVDLIPAKRQDGYQNYFSLWKNKQQTWTQTNVKIHIDTIVNSGRLDEIEGFKAGAVDVLKVDLVAFGTREIKLMRWGKEPPIRGTMVRLPDSSVLLYTFGYIPYLDVYPGPRVPSPLEILEHHGESSMETVCREIMSLTKLNWNNAKFCSKAPITIAFAKRVGGILRESPPETAEKEIGNKLKFYM